MQHTIADFWRMIWENEVSVVVMLANVIEAGKVRMSDRIFIFYFLFFIFFIFFYFFYFFYFFFYFFLFFFYFFFVECVRVRIFAFLCLNKLVENFFFLKNKKSKSGDSK